MKNLLIISGAISSFLILVGALFKINHWKGATWLLAIGLGIFILVGLYALIKYVSKKK